MALSKIDSYPTDISDLELDLPKVRKTNAENNNKIKEDSENKLRGKEEKQVKVAKKDIRSGAEYYQGWDKYISNWEKVMSFHF